MRNHCEIYVNCSILEYYVIWRGRLPIDDYLNRTLNIEGEFDIKYIAQFQRNLIKILKNIDYSESGDANHIDIIGCSIFKPWKALASRSIDICIVNSRNADDWSEVNDCELINIIGP